MRHTLTESVWVRDVQEDLCASVLDDAWKPLPLLRPKCACGRKKDTCPACLEWKIAHGEDTKRQCLTEEQRLAACIADTLARIALWSGRVSVFEHELADVGPMEEGTVQTSMIRRRLRDAKRRVTVGKQRLALLLEDAHETGDCG